MSKDDKIVAGIHTSARILDEMRVDSTDRVSPARQIEKALKGVHRPVELIKKVQKECGAPLRFRVPQVADFPALFWCCARRGCSD